MANFQQPDTTDYAAIYNASTPADTGSGGDIIAALARLGLTPADLAGASDAVLRALAGQLAASGASAGGPTTGNLAPGVNPGPDVLGIPGSGNMNGPNLHQALIDQYTALLPGLEAAAAAGQPTYAFGGTNWSTDPASIANIRQTIDLLKQTSPGGQLNPGLVADPSVPGGLRNVPVPPAAPAAPAAPGAQAGNAANQPSAAEQARIDAIPKLEDYIAELSAVKQPNAGQAAELSAYQKRLEEYKKTAAAPPVTTAPAPITTSTPPPTTTSAAPVVGSGSPPPTIASVSGAAPKVDYAAKAAAADKYYQLSAKPSRTAADNAQLAELRKQLAAP